MGVHYITALCNKYVALIFQLFAIFVILRDAMGDVTEADGTMTADNRSNGRISSPQEGEEPAPSHRLRLDLVRAKRLHRKSEKPPKPPIKSLKYLLPPWKELV